MGANPLERIIKQRNAHHLWIILPTVVSAFLYLGSALYFGGLGFPLDDAWIHQTLSRNLVSYGSLSVNPGEPIPATTSPLWSLLLAIGYWLRISPLAWAYLVGALSLGLTTWLTYLLSLRLFPDRRGLALAAGLLCATEWHLVWAAFSGMETLLFTSLALAVILVSLSATRAAPLLLGVVGGLATLARPEGVALLLGAILWKIGADVLAIRDGQTAAESGSMKDQGYNLGIALGPLLTLAVSAVLILPYLAYNHSSTGNILPSTFYAKNVFYAKGLGLEHLPQYILGIITALAPGPLLALLPGVMGVVFLSSLGRIRGKRGTELANAPFLWALTLPLGWVVLLFVMYFVWLPAPNIHHGRYLMPSIPILLLGGAAATARLLEHPTIIRWRRPIMEYVAIFTLAWWVIGAVIYSCNVKFINDQQVATALWLKANTSQGTVVATHDIGAIGYFSERAVLDTVGLITPELTYRPGEPEAVIALMRERGATYMAAFPSWHPWTLDDSRFQQIVEMSHRCFITSSPENMLIFRIAW